MRLEDLHNQRLGRYTITALLGRGGMAAVYRAHDTVLRRDVALKVLYPQYRGDQSLIARFQREAVLAAQLDHPNIVPIYDVGEAEGLVYIAMKLLGGPSLADLLLQQPKLPLPQVVAITMQVADALDYAHARGTIHRDVKPANILLEHTEIGDRRSEIGSRNLKSPISNLRAMLTDFGIAKSTGDELGLTGTNTMLGTPGSMAPEQITKQPIGPYTDVYALGVLVFRCLTGRQPFDGSAEAVLLGHLQGEVPAPSSLEPSLPAAIDQVVRNAMARRPEQRYASAGAFAEALQAAASAPRPATRHDAPTAKGVIIPPVARPAVHPSVPTPASPPSEGRSSPAIMFAVLVLLVLLGGGIAYLLSQFGGNARAGEPTALPTSAPTVATRPAATPIPPPTSVNTPTASVTPSPTTQPPATPTPTTQPSDTPPPTAAPSATPRPAPPTARPTAVPTAVPTDPPTPTPTTTPTTTPTSTPTQTPTNTPTPTPCSESAGVGPGFVQTLQEHPEVRQRVGCPSGRTVDTSISEQAFQRGSMIWFQELDTHYVLVETDSRIWHDFYRTDLTGMPVPTPATPPSTDLFEPGGGFKLIWGNSEEIRDTLGWAVAGLVEGREGAWQRFNNGIMLYSATGLGRGPTIYVLYEDGTFERY